MNDIYNVGAVVNPYAWKQPTAPAPQDMQAAPLQPIPALQPYLNVPDMRTMGQPPMQMPSRPPPIDYTAHTQPINYMQSVRPPLRADAPPGPGADMPLQDIVRLRKLAVESGDWRAPLDRIQGNYQAKNTERPGNTASGAYQYTNGTWGNYGGYAEARLAPKHVQDARANEDIARALRRYNGDIFKVFAEHMLPAQANKPWLWSQPSRLRSGDKMITIPPVLEYVRRSVHGTPYEAQLEQYIAAHQANAKRR